MKREDISLQTKRTFAASLKRIMGKKPFSKITVSEIIQDCNMNRKTFFYLFEDIYALLHWMLQEEAIEVVRNFDLLVDYEDAIIFVVDYIENNDHILNCALDSIGLDEMKRFLYADFIGAGESLISSAEEKFAVTLDPPYKRFLTEFFTEALAGIFVDWLKNHRRQDRDEIVRYLSVTVRRSLEGIFLGLQEG